MHRPSRVFWPSVVICVAVAGVGGLLARDQTPPPRVKALPPGEDLRRLADDPSAERAKRSGAIFTLFANHLRPTTDAAGVHKALGEAKWLQDAHIQGVYQVHGWIPVEFTFEDTVFRLYLFPDWTGWSDWVIYFRLSGGADGKEEDAWAFLKGSRSLSGNPSLVEFALCSPDGGIDRFSKGEARQHLELRPRR